MAFSPFLGIAIIIALISVLFTLYSLTLIPPSASTPPRLFTVEELAIYNGTDNGLPIFLGIIGSVFDVTKGKSHYGKGGGYNHFAGRDASRAFVSGNFSGDGLTDSLVGLSSTEVSPRFFLPPHCHRKPLSKALLLLAESRYMICSRLTPYQTMANQNGHYKDFGFSGPCFGLPSVTWIGVWPGYSSESRLEANK